MTFPQLPACPPLFVVITTNANATHHSGKGVKRKASTMTSAKRMTKKMKTILHDDGLEDTTSEEEEDDDDEDYHDEDDVVVIDSTDDDDNDNDNDDNAPPACDMQTFIALRPVCPPHFAPFEAAISSIRSATHKLPPPNPPPIMPLATLRRFMPLPPFTPHFPSFEEVHRLLAQQALSPFTATASVSESRGDVLPAPPSLPIIDSFLSFVIPSS